MRNHIQTSEAIDSQIVPMLPSKLKPGKVKANDTLNLEDQVHASCLLTLVQENLSDNAEPEKRTEKKSQKATKENGKGRKAVTGKNPSDTLNCPVILKAHCLMNCNRTKCRPNSDQLCQSVATRC